MLTQATKDNQVRHLNMPRVMMFRLPMGRAVFAMNNSEVGNPDTIAASPATHRYLLYGAPWGGCPDPQFKSLVDKAADVGFNAIRIVVRWHQHETKPDEYDFDALDRALDYVVKTKRLKTVVLIWLIRPAEPIRGGQDLVLVDQDLQQDASGQFSSMISFSSARAVERAAAFVKHVVAHCHERYADDILGYVTPFSQFAETEYWCQGEWGHEALSIQAYRAWLFRKYRTIDKLNACWESTYAAFEQIQPSQKGQEPGLSWYQFRHDALKRVIRRMASAVREGHPKARHALQFGSVFDPYIRNRTTVCFPDLCTDSHIVWVDDAPTYDHCFSMDYLRSSLPGKWICNEIDNPAQGSDEVYYRLAKESFEHGASMVSVANWPDLDALEKRAELFRRIARDFLAESVPEKTPVATLKIRAREVMDGAEAFRRQYNALSTNGRDWVRVLLEDDLSW